MPFYLLFKHFFLYIFSAFLPFYLIEQVDRQETKLGERERGDGIGKDPRAGTQTRDAVDLYMLTVAVTVVLLLNTRGQCPPV